MRRIPLKRAIVFMAIIIVFSSMTNIAFFRGLLFREETSPDGRFVVRSYQTFRTWDSIKFMRDPDYASGKVRLFQSNGKFLREGNCKQLWSLIVVWQNDQVEIQGDEVEHWKLPK